MNEPVWLAKEFVLAVHEELLAEFGGAAGTRDEGLLESALGRPVNLFAYENPSLCQLAAAYAHGIVKNHPFLDGNKRTGFMTAYVFLGRNNLQLVAAQAEAVTTTLALAAGEMTESEYAAWLEKNCKKIPD